ncbi:MAG: TIGR04165 family Cys-rich peptide [Euryarchaeota archaeon]|nr:TIGR04165 family Cys-rich peptide [Euryarchaeota archaeon]
MKLGKLDQKCPKCGCMDKTIKRDLEPVHHAHAKTKAFICSECGYVFKAGNDGENSD